MAFLAGRYDPSPDEGDIEEQDTQPTPARPDLATVDPRLDLAGAIGWPISPILEKAIDVAKTRNFVIPLCPVCLMRYEEELGEFINVERTFPELCWHHRKWAESASDEDRYLATHIVYTAHKWYLWPPGYKAETE